MSGVEEDSPFEDLSNDNQDDLLRERDFSRARGLDVSSFLVQDDSDEEPEKVAEVSEDSTDKAIGEISPIFTKQEDFAAGSIARDGTVSQQPLNDSVTDLAIHGERRIGFGLLIAMILSWSLIGTIVGTVLPPVFGAIGLTLMAIVGLYLGERWIPNPNMRILGVTWVIISMKLIYGLMLDLWHWGWLSEFSFAGENEILGGLLLAGVGLNILIGQRHDEDAIAAQAILILLVVGSAAGSVYGELGIAAMVALGTILFHSLALLRNSGNLTSMGVAVSYLWVGIHAISDDWEILGLQILGFNDELLLFLLMVCVTATNSIMAAKFYDRKNWFSDAFKSLGLGKPGLWSVSVGLGMIGALLSVTANRAETGYALAQLILLITAFSASYLVVRGVDWAKLLPLIVIPAPILLLSLSLLESELINIDFPMDLTPYSLYAVLTGLLTASALLRNQTAVSDHVLWIGGSVIVLLLTILIPANDAGDGARTLLLSQAIVWLGLAYLSLKRNSPSIAGTAVIGPWIWLIMFAIDIDSRLISADYIPISIDEYDLTIWLMALLCQQIFVNIRHGEVGLNLGARFAGVSELGARARDSKILELWNLSFIIALLVIWAMAKPATLPTIGLFLLLSSLMISHGLMLYFERHKGRPRTLMSLWGIVSVAIAWSIGQSAILAGALLFTVITLLMSHDRMQKAGLSVEQIKKSEAMPGRILTLMLGLMTGYFIILSLESGDFTQLTGGQILDVQQNLYALSVFAVSGLIMYLRRAKTVERLLPPAAAAVAMLIAMGLAGINNEDTAIISLSVVLFIMSGVYLSLQGEFRLEMKTLAKKDERLKRIEEKQQRLQKFLDSNSNNTEDGAKNSEVKTNLKMLDVEMLDLIEKQRKRSKRAGKIGTDDLAIGDIHHRPVIVLAFLITAISISAFVSFTTGNAYLTLAFCVIVSILFISVARIRSNEIGLRLPDVFGIELPIAISMIGLVIVHIAGRMSDSVVILEDAKHLAVLAVGLTTLAGIGLVGRNDLGLRIPNALEGVIFLLAIDRLVCIIIGGEVPNIYHLDPFAGDLIDWVIPLLFIEVLGVGAVLAYDWVEDERIKRELDDHRGASGRAMWVVAPSLISFGFAGLLAIVLVMRRVWYWKQPAALMIAYVLIPVVLSGMFYWFSDWVGIDVIETYLLASIFGVISILFVTWSVRSNYLLWMGAGIWASHILLIPSGFGYNSLVIASMLLLLCSGTAWISGILTMQRSWRVVGALDLLISWVVALIIFSTRLAIDELLGVLITSSILLGIVTYLNQTYENELSTD